MAVDNSFPKSLRLKKNQEFHSVFLYGKRYTHGCVTAFFLNNRGKKIGISVSSKKVKRSVDRNRIKRLIREVVRKEKNRIPDNFNIVFLYNQREIANYLNIYEDISHIIQKLQ